jgi:hypothetical protein
MVIARRLLELVEWALILFFSIALLMLLIDLPGAWDAEPCWPHASQGCYPWGMTEGPMEGGSWGYTSKENYLVSTFVGCAFISVLLLLCFVVPRKFRIAVLVSGLIAARFTEQVAIFAKPYLISVVS